MINEAIILAGGLGTRLRSAVPDLPKCMAPVAGHPFLYHVINYYLKQGISRFVFSLGYRHEAVLDYLEKNFPNLSYACSIEDDPLGTGGAVLKALTMTTAPNVAVLNGDTFFAVDLQQLASVHREKNADCTLVLKKVFSSDRYGVVETNEEGRVTSFLEKKFYPESTINGGVYALNAGSFASLDLPQKFSFEKEYLETYYHHHRIFGIVQNGYFIDIGIPEDYQRAQTELKHSLE